MLMLEAIHEYTAHMLEAMNKYTIHMQGYIDADKSFISYLRYDPKTGNSSWQFIQLDGNAVPPARMIKAFNRTVAAFAPEGTLLSYARYTS